jgi:predicted transcriptional regulator YdeE
MNLAHHKIDFLITEKHPINNTMFATNDDGIVAPSKAFEATETIRPLACRPKAPAKAFSSVIALGLPRTGSTLMFNFLTELGKHYPNIDNLSLFETFAPVSTMQLPGLTQIVDILRKNCEGLEPGEKSMFQQRFDFQSEQELYEYLRKDGHPEIYEPLIATHSNRYKDPLSWLHYVESIPSTGDYGYVEYKVFDHDMLEIGISSPELIDSMQSSNTKFVINYRRNLLESYVSQKIAEASGNWVGAKTTSDDAITINRQEFEDYIKAKETYFQEIRDHLERKNIPYSVFEYNTHLGAEPQQRDTLRHLQKLLRLRVDDTIVEDIMAGLRRKKQSTVPVREQIRNWEEVVQWGLGKEKDEDWEDLFASVDNSKALVEYQTPTQLACRVGAPAKSMSSVIALGLPRTGSTLMFNFLTELGKHYPNIDNLSLFETFAPVSTMQLPGLTQIVDILRKNCEGLEPGEKSMFQQRFDFQSEQELYEYLRKDGHPEIYEPLIATHSNRYKDPLSWLHYVESIPSTGDYGYVEYKVFDHDMLEIGISSPELIDSMQSSNTKFVINYRRNLLESYVSQKIAEASGNWVGAKTTSDDAITINRQEFEDYIKAKETYFQEIRDHLERKNIPYSVFEYNTHLGAEPQQRDTLRHLQKLLRLRVDDTIVEDIMAGLRRKKQSTVPVREQIRNWEEVVQWGLGKEKDEDWDDLFAGVSQSVSL